jgi:hypothetical protein
LEEVLHSQGKHNSEEKKKKQLGNTLGWDLEELDDGVEEVFNAVGLFIALQNQPCRKQK